MAALTTATRRLDRDALRGAWWALRALGDVRHDLASGRLEDVRVGAPPPLPAEAIRGVEAVLRRRRHSCLERSLLLQRWHAEHGRPLDVVIGVAAPASDFHAHAWLEDEPAAAGFDELMRLRP